MLYCIYTYITLYYIYNHMVTTDLIIYDYHVIIYVDDWEIKSIHYSCLVNYCHMSLEMIRSISCLFQIFRHIYMTCKEF